MDPACPPLYAAAYNGGQAGSIPTYVVAIEPDAANTGPELEGYAVAGGVPANGSGVRAS